MTLEFRGQSFVHTGKVPTFDGDPPNTPFQRERTATGRYDREHNAIHVVEGGTIMVKQAWKTPAVEGKLMYDGMSVVLAYHIGHLHAQLGHDKGAEEQVANLIALGAPDLMIRRYKITTGLIPEPEPEPKQKDGRK